MKRIVTTLAMIPAFAIPVLAQSPSPALPLKQQIAAQEAVISTLRQQVQSLSGEVARLKADARPKSLDIPLPAIPRNADRPLVAALLRLAKQDALAINADAGTPDNLKPDTLKPVLSLWGPGRSAGREKIIRIESYDIQPDESAASPFTASVTMVFNKPVLCLANVTENPTTKVYKWQTAVKYFYVFELGRWVSQGRPERRQD